MSENKVFWTTLEDDNFKMFDMNKIICVKKGGNGWWKVYLEGGVEVELTIDEVHSLYENVTEEYEFYEHDPDEYEEDNEYCVEDNEESNDSSELDEGFSLFGSKEKKINW